MLLFRVRVRVRVRGLGFRFSILSYLRLNAERKCKFKEDKAGTIHTYTTQFEKSVILSNPASIHLCIAFPGEENQNE